MPRVRLPHPPWPRSWRPNESSRVKALVAARHRLRDWGDRLCCVALLAAGLGGVALLGWYVWHMPALR